METDSLQKFESPEQFFVFQRCVNQIEQDINLKHLPDIFKQLAITTLYEQCMTDQLEAPLIHENKKRKIM